MGKGDHEVVDEAAIVKVAFICQLSDEQKVKAGSLKSLHFVFFEIKPRYKCASYYQRTREYRTRNPPYPRIQDK